MWSYCCIKSSSNYLRTNINFARLLSNFYGRPTQKRQKLPRQRRETTGGADAAPEAAPYLELGLRGDATRLTGIRLAKTPSQKIEIELGVPQFDPTFTPAELARYFR